MAKPSSINRAKIGVNVFIQIATLLVIVVMVNYLAFNHYRRWDYSRDRKYSLSEQTRRVLANLKKPVKFIVFFSSDSALFGDTDSLLREYKYAAPKKVDLEVVDTFRNLTRAREISSKYKLGSNENVVIVDYDGSSKPKFVNAADMADYEPSLNPMERPRIKAFKGEEILTSAVIEVTERGVNKLYSLTGHGEPSIEADSLTALKTYIERQNIKLDSLKLTDVDAIPADARGLVLIAPKYDFSDRELGVLRAYWNKNGRLLILLDPGSPTPKLAAFLNEQGITVNDDRVLKTMVLPGNFTGVLKEITGDFVAGSSITKRLNNVSAMFLGITQSLTLDTERVKGSNLKLQPLIQASKGFWAETHYEITPGHGIYFDPKEDKASPVFAASVEKGALNDTRVQVDSSRLIVVGNSAFVGNDAMREADLDFVLSSINWLLDREPLIGIAPKAVHNFALSLSEKQIGDLALLTMGVIPAVAALFGVFAWFKRRH